MLLFSLLQIWSRFVMLHNLFKLIKVIIDSKSRHECFHYMQWLSNTHKLVIPLYTEHYVSTSDNCFYYDINEQWYTPCQLAIFAHDKESKTIH